MVYLPLALTVLCTLLISGTLLNLFVEIAFCPGMPVVRLNSFSVSSIAVSDLTLSARWDVNFTVYNPNFVSVFSLDEIQSFVLYSEDTALSVMATEGFRLGSREEKSFRLKFGTAGREDYQPLVEYTVLKEIKEEKRRGTLRFGTRMSMWASYRTKLFGRTRRVVLSSYCLNLNVGLIENGGAGVLLGDGPLDCSVLGMLVD
ncbi:hypothetical protein SLE2022_080620 [Rubroshorea leprosula]